MKKKSFKIISLSLALLLLTAVIAPISASAASCPHENRKLISEKILRYSQVDEMYHSVVASRNYRCLDCGETIYDVISIFEEEHSLVVVQLLSHHHNGSKQTHTFTERVRCSDCGIEFERTRIEYCPGPPCLVGG